MRVSKQEAARTRERIIAAAAAEFRRKGIAGTGLSDLMAAAGLTHGGIYRHFESKDELIAEACAVAIDSITTMFATPNGGRNGIEAIAARYLSGDHRDRRSKGCPFAALGSELARADKHTLAVATEGLLKSLIPSRATSKERDLTSRGGEHWSRYRQWSGRLPCRG